MSFPETRPLPCGVIVRSRDEGSEGAREREPATEEPSAESPPPPPPRPPWLLSTDRDFCRVACRRMAGGRAGGGRPLAHRFLATRDEYEASPGHLESHNRAAWEGALLGARGGS